MTKQIPVASGRGFKEAKLASGRANCGRCGRFMQKMGRVLFCANCGIILAIDKGSGDYSVTVNYMFDGDETQILSVEEK